MNAKKNMILLTSQLAARFSWSKEPIERGAVFGLFKLPLTRDGQPIVAERRLLFMSKTLTDACVGGGRYSGHLKQEQGYSFDRNYKSEGFNDSLPVHKHSREASEGRSREAFVLLPYPVRTSEEDYKNYIACGLPFVDRTPESQEGWHQAMARMTVVQDTDEIDADAAYPEGAMRQVIVNAYERNPLARESCIAHYGALCVVCGFDFEDMYGVVGKGYIQVHHLRRLSDIGERYKVNPIDDLRPVCPNCHAMIHRRTSPYSIKELQTMVRKQKN